MNTQDIDSLITYIKEILFKRFPQAPLVFEEPKEKLLGEALFYLSNSIKEMNNFLAELCSGNLNATPPSKKNFLSGELKELHSSLLHLVWQAKQVAKGDYKQKVNFLGDYSYAFNLMVDQLSDREKQLKKKADYISHSLNLLTEVLNTLPEWVFVRKVNSPDILYKNLAAENMLTCNENEEVLSFCSPLYEFITSSEYPEENFKEEFLCPHSRKVFLIEGYPIEWREINAFLLIIKDITDVKVQEEILTDIAYKDPLTGLYNRWHMEDTLDKLLNEKTPFSLCFIDIDNLKQVNDNYGHEIGDEYILKVAQVLKKFLRNNDTVCRIGGDEFIAMLPHCNYETALEKFEKIFRDIKNKSPLNYAMSISYGIVFADSNSNLTKENLLKEADSIMYEFKKENKIKMD